MVPGLDGDARELVAHRPGKRLDSSCWSSARTLTAKWPVERVQSE